MARRSYSSGGRDTSFELDGIVFTPAAMSMLDFADLARYAELDTESAAGVEKLGEFFERILGGDFDRFRRHCATNHTNATVLLQILQDVLEDVVGDLPTQRPSDSSDGPKTTAPTLKVISSDGQVRVQELTPEREEELRAAVERAAAAQAG